MKSGGLNPTAKDVPMKRLVLISLSVILFAGCASSGGRTGFSLTGVSKQSEVLERIDNFIRNRPEDIIAGIGTARGESDWESIELAEYRALKQIARQVSLEIKGMRRHYYSDSMEFEEQAVKYSAITHIRGFEVVYRAKTGNGAWWCVIWVRDQQGYNRPRQSDVPRDSPADTAELPIRAVRPVSAIPGWVLNQSRYKPEDMMYGLGAANLGNDEASFRLAIERARKSIALSLHTEVSFDISLYDATTSEGSINNINDTETSITSEYEHTFISTEIVNLAKTKDGTWWVLLGCETDSVPTASFDTELRPNELFGGNN
jgi:hypothetical protein